MLDVVSLAGPRSDTFAIVQGLIPAHYWAGAWVVLGSFVAMSLGVILFRLGLTWFESFVR